MLRADLAPMDVFLADAMMMPEADFVARQPWPVLVIAEPDWEKIRQLSRPETLIPGQPTPAIYEHLDLNSSTASAASLDVLILPIRPLGASTPDRMSLGRGPDKDVVLLDETVSKLHAEISWEPKTERCVLTDCGSRNGITVDEQRVAERGFTELIPGSVVGFGSLAARYYSPRAFYAWLASGASRAGGAPR